MASPELVARWRKRLFAANAAAIRAMVRALRIEFVRVADDFEAGRWSQSTHARRLEELIVEHYRSTILRFAPIAREMLEQSNDRQANPIAGQFRAEQSMERALVERRLLETRDGYGVLFANRTAELLREHGPRRARQIAARTQRLVTKAIADAAAEGMGEAEAARLLRQRVASERLSVARARMIARTEIGAAQNAGLLASADELGVTYQRRWITTSDGRERLSHALADEQTIAAGQKFKVGGASLEHPGDPSGPPKEIINCRCTMLLEPM